MIDNAVAKDSITSRLKVEDGNDLQVGAPMKGEVLDIKVAMGEVVEKGQGKMISNCSNFMTLNKDIVNIIHPNNIHLITLSFQLLLSCQR